MKSPGSVCDGRRLEGGHPLIYPAIYFVFCNEIREPLIMTAGIAWYLSLYKAQKVRLLGTHC